MNAAHARHDHGQETKKLVAFGGTGKTVALIYLKIGRLLGEQAQVTVCDFPASSDYNSPDGRLDRDLLEEGVSGSMRITTLPSDIIHAPTDLVETFGLPHDVANALFTQKQQQTPPTEGLNQEPQVGSTVAHFKLQKDAKDVASRCLSGPDEIFLVAGLGGGTGTGVTPAMARFLKQRNPNVRIHGVFLLPWQHIGSAGEVNDTGQERNAKSLLRYLHEHSAEMFDDYVIIGSAPGIDRYDPTTGNGKEPVHPTLILAALYVHLYHDWGGGAQLTSRSHRIETLAEGISLEEITGRNGNLYHMLVHSVRMERILNEFARQAPDERLSWLSLYPLSIPLGWDCTEWLLKKYAQKTSQSYGAAWDQISSSLIDLRDRERRRREWIVNLARDQRLFRFDEHAPARDAAVDFDNYRNAVKSSTTYREFAFRSSDHAGARADVCEFLQSWASRTILQQAKR